MEQPHVVASRTALVLLFQWDSWARTADAFAEMALSRRLPKRRADKEPCPLWQDLDVGKRSEQLYELSGSIRAILGLTRGADAAPGISEAGGPAARWLELQADARQILLSKAVLTDGRKATPVARPVVEGVELVVFPIGVGALLFRLDWQPKGAPHVPVTHLRHVLHVARTVVTEPSTPGWRLDGAPPVAPDGTAAPSRDAGAEDHSEALGPALTAALYGGDCVDLRTVAAWLLTLPGDPDGAGERRLGRSRYAFHQTAIVLDAAPQPAFATELLFHLRRGYDSEYAPPPDPGRDQVLVPRANRLVGVSREGAASLSWVTGETNDPFETLDWPLRFTRGVYLTLALLVHAERAALSRLEELVAAQVSTVLRLKRPGVAKSSDHAQTVQRERDALRALAVDMVQYTLTMTPDDTGAITDYDDFFDALSAVYGVKDMQAAVRDDLREVVSLVDATYHELHELRQHEEALEQAERFKAEQDERAARLAAEEREWRRQADERQRDRDAHEAELARRQAAEDRARALDERRDRRVNFVFALLGGLTLPIMLVASVFGMEISPRPNPNFWVVIACGVALSLVVALLVWVVLRRPSESAAADPANAPGGEPPAPGNQLGPPAPGAGLKDAVLSPVPVRSDAPRPPAAPGG